MILGCEIRFGHHEIIDHRLLASSPDLIKEGDGNPGLIFRLADDQAKDHRGVESDLQTPSFRRPAAMLRRMLSIE
jgi:hypothetical protein